MVGNGGEASLFLRLGPPYVPVGLYVRRASLETPRPHFQPFGPPFLILVFLVLVFLCAWVLGFLSQRLLQRDMHFVGITLTCRQQVDEFVKTTGFVRLNKVRALGKMSLRLQGFVQ